MIYDSLNRLVLIIICIGALTSLKSQENADKRWSVAKAKNWYANHDYISGANFLPSTSINQLEMWQESTFDKATIDRELGYASEIGFNTMRVYLHSLVYEKNPVSFKKRIDEYLKIADSYDIKTIFVFFDDVWNKSPKIGIQPSPKPGVHNSGWVQDPGDPASKDPKNFPRLETYVTDIMSTFKEDKRILMWDLYNEPGNSKKFDTSLPLLKKTFEWARNVNPSQPITAGLWNWSLQGLNSFQALNSDIITYHEYNGPKNHKLIIQLLKTHGRPMICTEYMARTRNSRFSNILPLLKEYNIGAINWGLVNGKSNTIYQWDTPIESGEEPVEWFHDIFRKNGTPYRKDEVDLIKKINKN